MMTRRSWWVCPEQLDEEGDDSRDALGQWRGMVLQEGCMSSAAVGERARYTALYSTARRVPKVSMCCGMGVGIVRDQEGRATLMWTRGGRVETEGRSTVLKQARAIIITVTSTSRHSNRAGICNRLAPVVPALDAEGCLSTATGRIRYLGTVPAQLPQPGAPQGPGSLTGAGGGQCQRKKNHSSFEGSKRGRSRLSSPTWPALAAILAASASVGSWSP